MRNFKKISAVTVAASIALSTAVPAFAAYEPVNGSKASVLHDLNLYAGISDKEFDPDLGSKLTRGQAAVLLTKIFNLDTAANALTSTEVSAILKPFADGKDVPTYAANRMAYLVKNGFMSGSLDTATGKVYIDARKDVNGAQFATLLLKQLGYDVADWKTAITQLSQIDGAQGIAEYLSYALTSLLRDQAVGMIYGTLTADYAATGLETVIDKLIAANSSLRAIAEAAGLVTPESLAVESVVAIANNKVAITLKDPSSARTTDFAIVKKGTSTAVAIKNIVKESDKVYVLETDALVGGTSYTLTVKGENLNFTGIAADTTAPTIKAVSSKDTNTFEIEFSDKMDFATATDKANYTFDKDIKVVSAALDAARTKVTLVTDSAKKNIVYTLTIQNVKNSDGKAMTKAVRTVTATEDSTAPRVSMHRVQNNRTIIVDFNDASGMAKAALENVENYSINDLTVESAKAYDMVGDDGKYDQVVLTTSTQEANKSYTLTLSNLTDASVLKNALGTTARTFRGAPADVSAPTVNISKPVVSQNNNTVKIWFTDNNAMDVASLEDISNYTIKDNTGSVLEIISAKAMASTYPDAYSADNKGVILTTAQQIVNPNKVNYTVEVKGVQDEFGNALKPVSGTTYARYNFISSDVDEIAPYVTKVEFVNSTTVKFTFAEELKKSTAIDPTNYVIDGDLGSAIKAELSSDRKTVTLTTQTQAGNKKYTVTMNNLEDDYGNRVSNAKASFVSTSGTLDVTAPEVSYIYAMNKGEIHVTLTEGVKAWPSEITFGVLDNSGNMTGTLKVFQYSGKIEDGKTIVYKAKTAGDALTSANYQIQATTGGQFTDASDNKMSAVAPIAAGTAPTGYTFNGNTIENTAPTVDYVEQIDTKTVRVYFNEPVAPASFGTPGFSKIDSDSTDTHFTSLDYSLNTNFTVGTALSIPVNQLRDLAGTNIAAAYTGFTPYLQDTTKPVITGAYADDNKTVYVLYDEKVPTSGTYKIYYLNSSNNPVTIFSGAGTSTEDPNKVPAIKLTLTTPVDASKIYYIEPVTGAVDVAGNRADVSGVKFDFPGTNKTVSGYITGVEINNAKTITVGVSGKTISSINVYEVDTTTSPAIDVDLNATVYPGKTIADGKVQLAAPLLAGVQYKVTVGYVGGGSNDYTFSGNTPDIGLKLTTAPGSINLDFAGFDTDEYKFEAVAATDFTNVIAGTPVADGTPGNTLDNVVAFADASFTAGTAVYVTIYDKDDTTRVLYAGKVIIAAP